MGAGGGSGTPAGPKGGDVESQPTQVEGLLERLSALEKVVGDLVRVQQERAEGVQRGGPPMAEQEARFTRLEQLVASVQAAQERMCTVVEGLGVSVKGLVSGMAAGTPPRDFQELSSPPPLGSDPARRY
eukprot:TRINITY_DN4705_c0_g1_i7.p2 TRINITY_DN4705_c0_g1~~TRINITY_DN4705_c0_g1_i7.p2  ORF type:complete len:129 (+),score=27.75 TRINITY_DN4705_c0_g1_i7:257-643(+)